MALTSINANYERMGRGNLYIVARPSSDPGVDSTARVHGYKALFYAVGDTGVALKSGVKAYANLTADGLSIKSKQNMIEFEPNNGPKHPVGVADTEIDLEFEFADVDAAHVADVFNLSASELIAIAAASGKAGRSFALVGGQSSVTAVSVCYQMPSVLVPGQFDNEIFPRVILSGDSELKLGKKSGTVTLKVKGSALPDTYLLNADGFGESWIHDVATAAAL